MKKRCSLIVVGVFCLIFTTASWGEMNFRDLLKICSSGTAQEVRAVLLKQGVNRDMLNRSDFDLTPLVAAINNKNREEVIPILLKAGADVNGIRNMEGQTPLMYAAIFSENPKIISLLLKAGADINRKDMYGNTALALAARRNKNPEIISLLVKAGADINRKDIYGKTALDRARENRNEAAIKVLSAKIPGESDYQLGIKYANGDGVKQDTKKAVELFRKAAKKGHQKAKEALKLFE